VLSVLEFAIVDRYIGCLENKEDVCRFSSKPIFYIVGKVGKYDISKADMLLLNERVRLCLTGLKPLQIRSPDRPVVFTDLRPYRSETLTDL
jgi:hypothetical protein